MPWIQVTETIHREIWLRTESILGLVPAEGGTRLLLISGEALDTVEEPDALLQKVKEAEGTAKRERRVGFPGD